VGVGLESVCQRFGKVDVDLRNVIPNPFPQVRRLFHSDRGEKCIKEWMYGRKEGHKRKKRLAYLPHLIKSSSSFPSSGDDARDVETLLSLIVLHSHKFLLFFLNRGK